MDEKTPEWMKQRVDQGEDLQKRISYLESKVADLQEIQTFRRLEFGVSVDGWHLSSLTQNQIRESLVEILKLQIQRLKQEFAEL